MTEAAGQPEWRQIVSERASARIQRLHEELDAAFDLAVELDDARDDREDDQ